jgi:hypothetical protein
MITELREALVTKLKTVCDRVYFGTAPASVVYPYIIIANTRDDRSQDSASKFLDVSVDISIYEKSENGKFAPTICETMTENMRQQLEDNTSGFVLDSYYVISIDYQYTKVLPYADNVFQYVSVYKFSLQKK